MLPLIRARQPLMPERDDDDASLARVLPFRRRSAFLPMRYFPQIPSYLRSMRTLEPTIA